MTKLLRRADPREGGWGEEGGEERDEERGENRGEDINVKTF